MIDRRKQCGAELSDVGRAHVLAFIVLRVADDHDGDVGIHGDRCVVLVVDDPIVTEHRPEGRPAQ